MIWVFAIQKLDPTLSIHCIHLQEGIECQPSKPRNLTVLIETRSVFFYSSSLFIHNVTALIETIRENRRPDIAKKKSVTAVRSIEDRETVDHSEARQQHCRQSETASWECQEEPCSKYETGSNKSDCNHRLRQERYLWRGQKVSRGRWLALREAWNPSFGTPALVGSVSLGESKSFHQKWSREPCCPAHCVHTMLLGRIEKETLI